MQRSMLSAHAANRVFNDLWSNSIPDFLETPYCAAPTASALSLARCLTKVRRQALRMTLLNVRGRTPPSGLLSGQSRPPLRNAIASGWALPTASSANVSAKSAPYSVVFANTIMCSLRIPSKPGSESRGSFFKSFSKVVLSASMSISTKSAGISTSSSKSSIGAPGKSLDMSSTRSSVIAVRVRL